MTVLLLQCRPEDEAADEEYGAILSRGGLTATDVRRVRLEQDDPGSLSDVRAIIMGGGPACVSDPDPTPAEAAINDRTRAILKQVCARDIPFLGLCYGVGALAAFLGGQVDKSARSEPISVADLGITPEGRADPLLEGVPKQFTGLVAHKEAAQEVPPDATLLVEGTACPVQMIRYRSNVYATQFHPEANGDSFALRIGVYRDRGYFDAAEADALQARVSGIETPHAARILRNFVDRFAR
ncbi:GMP synthase [glutamine-hydrolyzing] [Rhodobacteraceae bacterium THAF1]|uniref:glutamine amidotransferase n=1 Tax=Palleronia sp. THAF1 TaxID=2587842 RepID=UPI000F3AC764|nr:glutamine amidotransferase [Palleronia sp. THAF1]QFU08938.1 GMP synthase [glutamine-hydrolyzing] [Palleronia sp. THAF1]VDC24331.1 GMP synthase [glutamine-hydrolyzing] [Rhodobacteraceae bacterium THAF1]